MTILNAENVCVFLLLVVIVQGFYILRLANRISNVESHLEIMVDRWVSHCWRGDCVENKDQR